MKKEIEKELLDVKLSYRKKQTLATILEENEEEDQDVPLIQLLVPEANKKEEIFPKLL